MQAGDIDLALYAGTPVSGALRNVDYLSLAGVYPTASAFALHYAVDLLGANREIRNVLICNALRESNLGLTLLKAVEA